MLVDITGVNAEKGSLLRKQIEGAIIPAFFGIGEPMIYGVTLPRIKPFVTTAIGAGIGGFLAAFMMTTTTEIYKKSTYEILTIINNEDALIAQAIKKELKEISKVIELIYDKFKTGGRLIYLGAGSSGGNDALRFSQEGVEDDELLAIDDLKAVDFNSNDILIGITASGRTPYVLSALRYCQVVQGLGIGLTMNANSGLEEHATKVITIDTGQEVIAGSTRMKAGTATKLVLNMISTTLMIKYGKVYQNLMIDVIATNEKLKARVLNIVEIITNADTETIAKILVKAEYNYSQKMVNGLVAKQIEIPIVYEDDDLIIVDKPNNLVVHPGADYQPFNVPEKFREEAKGKVYLVNKKSKKYQVIKVIKQNIYDANEIKTKDDQVIDILKKDLVISETNFKMLILLLNTDGQNEFRQSPVVDMIIATPNKVVHELKKIFPSITKVIKTDTLEKYHDEEKQDEESTELSARQKN
ncbi:n-acetylmuramic acid 6-phosphate etherase [Lasius niger]|uniref:N-acetylmuramic acid 6-phosphate etherase n=1 Tax=Lasius niger TaxID=67767 RepID=A0A0J7NIW7_LASNI|nr:n-acetylmuramic acid 6-phosphate etherase [Lasius niger]